MPAWWRGVAERLEQPAWQENKSKKQQAATPLFSLMEKCFLRPCHASLTGSFIRQTVCTLLLFLPPVQEFLWLSHSLLPLQWLPLPAILSGSRHQLRR